MNTYLLLGLGALILSTIEKDSHSPRGIRNNNPGNLIKTSIPWDGKVPHSQNSDSRFEQFVRPEYGIRAMFKDVKGDIERKGQNTVRKLLTSYAPMFENDTGAYIKSVSDQAGIKADDRIMPHHYPAIINAIIHHENGQNPYSAEFVDYAISLA